jgi:hypothetical protein
MFRPSLALAILCLVLPPAGASARSATPSAKSQAADAAAPLKSRAKVGRHAGFRAETASRQRTCGAYMYFKNGKCNDARDKK